MKECPCCGSIEVQTHCKKRIGKPVVASHQLEIDGYKYWYVECLDCGLRTRNCFDHDADLYGFDDGKEWAVSLWDTRKSIKKGLEICEKCNAPIVETMCCCDCKIYDAMRR